MQKLIETQKYEIDKKQKTTAKLFLNTIKESKELSFKFNADKTYKNVNFIDKFVRDLETKISNFKDENAKELKEFETQELQLESEIAKYKQEMFLDDKGFIFENDQLKTEEKYNERTHTKKNTKNVIMSENNFSNIESKSNRKMEASESKSQHEMSTEINALEAIKIQINAINDQIDKNGGRDCGWMKIDHEDFIKIFVKKGKNPKAKAFKDCLYKNFPLFSVESINSHVEKFTLNEQLNSEKKELLLRYKQFQQKNAKEELVNFHEIEQRENLNNENQKLQVILNKEKEERLKNLKDWKIQKEKQERETLAIKKKEEQKKKEIFELTKVNEDIEKKDKLEMIQKFREQKELKRLMSAEQNRYEHKMKLKMLNVEDFMRIKEKEELLLKKKKELIIRKKLPELEKKERLENFFNKIEQKFDYVENDLTHQTVAHVTKANRKFDFNKDKAKFGDNFAGNLVRTEGRKLVEWRNGV